MGWAEDRDGTEARRTSFVDWASIAAGGLVVMAAAQPSRAHATPTSMPSPSLSPGEARLVTDANMDA